jgi:hypothetical protein
MRGLVLGLSLLSLAAFAGDVTAARTASPPKIDGQIDAEEWAAATPYSDFVQSWPKEGEKPSQKTEVRVMYDDHTLYFGVICYDTEPEKIVYALGRRDSTPISDLVEIAIDSAFDRRSAYYFSVNASGVLRDALIYGDINLSDSWDAVWQGAAAKRPDGWSVEVAIPLAIMRFPAAHEQKWGYAVRRDIMRTHEQLDTTLLPRSANANVSLFGQMKGVLDLKPRPDVEIVPYLGARLASRPQFSDSTMPHPRLLDPSADLGVDVRASLFSDLILNATINPDFGQVEADQIILNLSTQEVFFPEKRPFFNQGLDIFQPVGAEYGTPHQLFYSRRIGLDTPILTAAKITGAVAPGTYVGVLDAVVLGPADPGKASVAFNDDPSTADITNAERTASRGFVFHPERPLHFGLNDELPADRPTPKNFVAAAARHDFSDRFALGATFTSASPLAARCKPSDFNSIADYQAASCLGEGGQALGLDWNLRSANRDWVFLGMLDGSRREGGPLQDTQRDGTVLHPGDLGYGGYFRAGKFGGEGLRADINGNWTSPTLDLNQTGFMPSNNQSKIAFNVRYVRTKELPFGLRDLYAALYSNTFWTTDGRWQPRGNYYGGEVNATFPSYYNFGVGWNLDNNRYDVREITGTGIPLEKHNDFGLYAYGSSDPNQPIVARASTQIYRTEPKGLVPPETGYGADAIVLAHPFPRFDTQVVVHWSVDPNGARWLDTLPDLDLADPSRQHFLFGQQDSQNFSVTLRQTVVFTPTLTLQAYAQFFSAFAHYPRYYEAGAPSGGHVHIDDLARTSSTSNYDFHSSALNLNVVLRWEYRLGSTLFLVYSRSQNELGFQSNQPPTTHLFPARLGPGPTTDTLLLKFSYWFNV